MKKRPAALKVCLLKFRFLGRNENQGERLLGAGLTLLVTFELTHSAAAQASDRIVFNEVITVEDTSKKGETHLCKRMAAGRLSWRRTSSRQVRIGRPTEEVWL